MRFGIDCISIKIMNQEGLSLNFGLLLWRQFLYHIADLIAEVKESKSFFGGFECMLGMIIDEQITFS
jgi:hypothetical protein